MYQLLIALTIVVLATRLISAGVTIRALLDPEKLPQAALLEAKLLADPAVTWGERSEIDKILKEQKRVHEIGRTSRPDPTRHGCR